MRSAAVGLVAVLVIGLGIVAWRALANDELDAVRPGILAASPVATLKPGREMCQRPLDLDRPVPRIGLAIYNGPAPGPRIQVHITDLERDRVVSRFTVPRGWGLAPGQYFGVKLPRPLPGDTAVEVCARNEGHRSFELYGSPGITDSRLYAGHGDRVGIDPDWAIFFPLLPDERRSLFAAIPDIVKRASVLRPSIIGPAAYGGLALLLLVGGPLLMWRALRASEDAPQARGEDAPPQP